MGAHIVRECFLRNPQRLMVVVLTCFISSQLTLDLYLILNNFVVESFILSTYSTLLPFLTTPLYQHFHYNQRIFL